MKSILTVALLGWLGCSCLWAGEPASVNHNFFQFIRAGDHATVRAMAKAGGDLNQRNVYGDTPLMVAAWMADAPMIEILIKAGAEINATNFVGATALMRAATFEDKTRLLVAAGAEVSTRSQLGNTALTLAARESGNSRTVKLLLDRGASPNVSNALGATPLMAAVAAQDSDSVRLLLDRGADVNAKPNMDVNGFIWGGGRSPLMWAAFLGDEELIRLLLARGAKVNDFGVVGGALGQAAWGGQVGAARLLLNAGAQVDQRDLVANYTPLHWAASSEHASPALVELLLARGADHNAEGGQPVDNFLGATQTPISLARKRGFTPIVQALLNAGTHDAAMPVSARERKVTDPAPSLAASKTVAEAIQRALLPLTKTAEESVATYFRHASKQSCVSCHQQQLPLAAISLAHSRGLKTDREAVRHQIDLLKRDLLVGHVATPDGGVHTTREVNLQATFHPEPGIFAGYASRAFQLEHEPASEATDDTVHMLTTFQHADGHWSWNLPRPPIQASDITATALAVHFLQTYGLPARRRELDSRVNRARTWLAKARAETNEERVHQLLGLAWAGQRSGGRDKFAEDLIRQQRADGGWGQLAGLPSDAYATGQAIVALLEAGKITANRPALRRGLDYLLKTQLADGTWHVRRRAHPFQPPMESGFAHGADGWISSSASSWAVMALALSLDPAEAPAWAELMATMAKPATPAGLALSVPKSAAPTVEFARDIQPVLERSCVACHSGERAKGGFQMTARESFLHGGARGEPAVVAGKAEASPLVRFVQDQVQDLEMPPLGKRGQFPALTKDETALLRIWIDQGAVWPAGTTLRIPGK